MVKIFDIENGKVVLTEHCYTLKSLRVLMDVYPDKYLKVYQYIFYMSCPYPGINPFANLPAEQKEPSIAEQLDVDFSLDSSEIIDAIKICSDLYETPTTRAYDGIKTMLDKLGIYLKNTEISHGRDGSILSMIRVAKDYKDIRLSYKAVYDDLIEEQAGRSRGGHEEAYDQQ